MERETITKKCEMCPDTFETRMKRQRVCKKCRPLRDKILQAAAKKRNKEQEEEYEHGAYEPSLRLDKKSWKPRPRQKIMTDAQQKEINKQIDTKHNLVMESRILDKNSEEFKRIAEELMSKSAPAAYKKPSGFIAAPADDQFRFRKEGWDAPIK